MSKIFDSHCHPQFSQYDADREAMLSRAQDAGISMICVGTDLKTSQAGIDLASSRTDLWATVGIHPNDIEEFNKENFTELLKQPKVVAVGEIGLDYYRTEGEEAQHKQKEKFTQQLELAKESGLPVVLHCRDSKAGSTGRAYPDMIEILKKYPGVTGVVHSCTASLAEAIQFLDLGFYLGFNGIITFARMYDEVVRFAPLERILLETDAPYLTPEPNRKQRNEPAFVMEVACKLAELKNVPLEEVIEKTTKNCQNLFTLHA